MNPINSSLVLLLLSAAGCGTWNAEKLEQATVASIDDGLRSGMPFDEFRREFPDAMLIRGNETSGDWLVATHKVCFVCTSADGFRRSLDTYTRIVRFEQDKLTAVNPLPQEQGID